MFSAAQYNFKWLKQWPLGHLFGEALLETSKLHFWMQSELPFAQKVWAYFPHRARWRCCPSLLLKEHVSQQTCCLSFLRKTLTSEAEISFCCFSLQFTCRARGRRCILFWVTHTSTELSTKGQASGINSSLAWTYTKPLSTFFTLTTVRQWPRLAREVVQSLPLEFFRIQPNKVLHNLIWSQSQPCWKQGVGLETSWHSIKPAFSYESVTLGQLFWSDQADPWAWREGQGREGSIS